ncbi:MAG TPA: sigma-70 family RNA polymerase sigma factor [Phycisphaerales bacterium]|nr:sigma-70 family RNA polymerase sigma factor [Phycisphaerales bacterium]
MTPLRVESGQTGSRAGAGVVAPAALGPRARSGDATDGVAAAVERARRGDREAFAELYRAHGAMVHGVLLAAVPRAQAEDLTQEVFLLAWRRLAELRDAGALAAWLVSIARSRAMDWARADGRRRGHEECAARSGAPPAGTTEKSDGEDRAEAVLAAIRGLPAAYREPLMLRLVAGLTGPQIACCLGMTHGSVRVNLHRGMAMLRQNLAEDRS